jgi:hypothetical protein
MTQQEALRKALACLKLAERGGTPEESSVAAAKAQALIDAYKLDVTGLDYNENVKEQDNEQVKNFDSSDPVDEVRNWKFRWATTLASTVARNNQCRIYRSPGQLRSRICIVGRPSDVQTARYIYGWLKNEVERLVKENCTGNSGTYIRHYCLGVVDTICERLHKMQQETFAAKKAEVANNSTALVLVKDSLVRLEKRANDVAQFMKTQMKLRSSRSSASQRVFSGGREAGQRDGHSVRMGAHGAVGRGVAGHLQ